MKPLSLFVMSAFALTPSLGLAHELRVSASLIPARADLKIPNVQVRSDEVKLEAKGQSVWTYQENTAGKMLGSTSIAFDPMPSDYSSESLKVRLPSGRKQPLLLVLHGLQIQDNAKTVEEIFATNVASGQLRADELFRLYQETSFISMKRLRDLEGGKRPLYKYDVQIFFKYLEIARELGRLKFVAISDNVLGVQTYLRKQLGRSEGQSAINKALGKDDKGTRMLDALLKEIDLVDAEQLRQVWQSIASTPPSFTPEACNNYKAFLKTLDDYDDMLVNRWNENPKYKMATYAAEALQTCASRAEAAAAADPKAAIKEVSDLSRAIGGTSSKALTDERIGKSALNIKAVQDRLKERY